MKNKSTIVSLLYSVAILFFECCYLLPSAKIYFDITKIAAISFIFALLVFDTSLKYKIIPQTFLYTIPFLLLHFFVGYQGDFWHGFLHPLLLLWFTLFPAFLCYDIMNNRGKIEVISAVLFFLIIFSFVGYNTIGKLQYDENILRTLTSGAEGEDFALEMAINNNGGFGFVYAVGVFFVASIAILINVIKINIWWRCSLIAMSILLFMIVTSAQFTTLLLLVIIMSFIVILLRVNKKYRLILILLSPLIFLVIPYLFDLLISYYGGSVTGEHLMDLNSYFKGETFGDTASGRNKLMSNALLASLDSPLWGQSVIGTDSGRAARSCHSVVLANLIETGLIGVYFKFKAILYPANSVMNKIDYSLRRNILRPTILYFILLSILNPIEQIGDINMTVFMGIPLLVFLISKMYK